MDQEMNYENEILIKLLCAENVDNCSFQSRGKGITEWGVCVRWR